jgi:hypothetical protein
VSGADGNGSVANGHRWPCTRFYSFSTDRDRCTCGPAAPAPGAVSRPDGEVCDCLNPMCSHRSARPAAPAVEADLRESLAKWLYLNTAPPSRHPAEPGRVWLAGSALTAADALLAGPLRSLVEQAAEAARLRGTVTRAEALHSRRGIPLADIWCTQDGADG